MPKTTVRLVVMLLAAYATPGAWASGPCDAVVERIRKEMVDKGIEDFSIRAVPAGSPSPGKIVGHCAGGARKIVFARGTGTADAAESAESADADRPVAHAPTAQDNAALPPLPEDARFSEAAPDAPAEIQLEQALQNLQQLEQWKILAQRTAEQAVRSGDIDRYRAASALRAKLMPTSLQFQSAYDAAQRYLALGFHAEELPALSESQLHYLAACKAGDCHITDARTALFMAPVVGAGPPRASARVPRPPAPRDARIQLPDFPGLAAEPAAAAQAVANPAP